jgi:hypothetical protein
MVHAIDDITVGIEIPGDCSPARLRAVELQLAAVRASCLVVDMSRGPAASPELAHSVARLIDRAGRRGFSMAIVSPGADVVHAIVAGGASRAVEFVATADEGVARVRGRLTPARTIRVLRAA